MAANAHIIHGSAEVCPLTQTVYASLVPMGVVMGVFMIIFVH